MNSSVNESALDGRGRFARDRVSRRVARIANRDRASRARVPSLFSRTRETRVRDRARDIAVARARRLANRGAGSRGGVARGWRTGATSRRWIVFLSFYSLHIIQMISETPLDASHCNVERFALAVLFHMDEITRDVIKCRCAMCVIFVVDVLSCQNNSTARSKTF